ncbi:MAG: LysR family transcriptional regulator [Gammaproteobacteria bacterium]
MDLRQLRYFVAVAEERNIGRAANRLHISQPPLSRQIQQLEEQLGTRLFERTPRGVDLTQAGTMLLDEARNILALVDVAADRARRSGEGRMGRLDIAIFGSAILDRIPKLLLQFRKRNPDVRIVLHGMNKTEQIQALRQRRIDLGFNRMLAPLPDITSELITHERLMVAVGEHDTLAELDEVPTQAMAERPLILYPSGVRPSFMDKVMSLCHERGFEPEVAQEVGDAVTAVALVAAGFGICLVPESATTVGIPGVTYKAFSDPSPSAMVDLSCIYRAEDESPLLGAFLECVRKFKGEMAMSAQPA